MPRDNDSNLRGLAPHFALTAEVLDGLGITDGNSATFTLARPDGQQFDVPLTAVGASRYIAQFTDPLYGHYPSILPRRSEAAVSGRQRQADVGANARRWEGGLHGLQLGPVAVSELSP